MIQKIINIFYLILVIIKINNPAREGGLNYTYFSKKTKAWQGKWEFVK
jgi:hypothetical protein